jgi:hypothetical protein
MSGAENPERTRPGREITVEDIRALSGAVTPHFALQVRDRIRNLIRGLEAEDPARLAGEREIRRLEALAVSGEARGNPGLDGERPLPSLGEADPELAPEPSH